MKAARPSGQQQSQMMIHEWTKAQVLLGRGSLWRTITCSKHNTTVITQWPVVETLQPCTQHHTVNPSLLSIMHSSWSRSFITVKYTTRITSDIRVVAGKAQLVRYCAYMQLLVWHLHRLYMYITMHHRLAICTALCIVSDSCRRQWCHHNFRIWRRGIERLTLLLIEEMLLRRVVLTAGHVGNRLFLHEQRVEQYVLEGCNDTF